MLIPKLFPNVLRGFPITELRVSVFKFRLKLNKIISSVLQSSSRISRTQGPHAASQQSSDPPSTRLWKTGRLWWANQNNFQGALLKKQKLKNKNNNNNNRIKRGRGNPRLIRIH